MDQKPRILLVDDEVENLKALERTLRDSFQVTACETPAKALAEIEKQDFAAIVSDQRMPDMTGVELLDRVCKKRPLITRIILTGFTESKDLIEAINRAEIYRYVVKPWNNQEMVATLKQAVEYHQLRTQNAALISELQVLNTDLESQVKIRTQELQEANEKLQELAVTDPLTKIFNRRVFSGKMTEEIERSRRYEHPMAVAMIDVDHFKQFNDMEGHPIGDEALKKVAHTIKGKIRKTDVFCRYGGEEFCLMMPETDLVAGKEICERLRASVENAVFQGKQGRAYLTVSIGVAGFPEHGDNISELIENADEALYQAKNSGRNRVMIKSDDASFFQP